jgi:hypothetical protein
MPEPGVIELPPVPARRIFSDAAIQGALDRALLSVPDGHHTAFVAHADLKEWVVAGRYENGPWSVGGYLKKAWKDGELEAGAELRFSL